jgi:hypothetical protein
MGVATETRMKFPQGPTLKAPRAAALNKAPAKWSTALRFFFCFRPLGFRLQNRNKIYPHPFDNAHTCLKAKGYIGMYGHWQNGAGVTKGLIHFISVFLA